LATLTERLVWSVKRWLTLSIERQDAQAIDRAGADGRGMAPVLPWLGCDCCLRLAAGGMVSVFRRGSRVSGGVGNWGDAAPAAQHEAGELLTLCNSSKQRSQG